MKRFIAVLSGLLVMPAFAEVMPVYYEDLIEYTDDYIDDEDVMMIDEAQEEAAQPVAPIVPVNPSPRNTASRTATRVVPTSGNTTGTAATRATTQRPVSSRTAAGQQRATASRTGGTVTTRATVGNSNTQAVSTRRNTAAPATAARAGLIQADTVSSSLYTGRVGVRNTNTVATRAPTIRIATSGSTATTTSTSSAPSLDEIAQLTDFCKAQYTQCMDNFCSVLDDNQGRCSCSVNIKNYSKTENGLKQATEELQEVAQKIQYIGLTRDEIETLFTQTEAESAMQGRVDNTQLKTDLDKVKNMIFDVRTANATTTDTGLNMDLGGLLDFSFDSAGFDLGTLFGNNTTNSSISNQRGADLYKTASARCKGAVLNSCQAQGVDTTIITNGYDLEIDKQCIVYERSLNDANTQMTQTVRNAKSVLQKARLVVAQQKNAYDLRGCINALDACMQDEFVCGTDYENCLDPSGKYIVNGSVVIGSEPGVSGGTLASGSASGLYTVWNYTKGTATNAWGAGNLGEFITTNISNDTVSTNMVGYLQQKIGKNTDGKNVGMCMSVLNKCQDVTYDPKDGKYMLNNKAVEGYLQRTLIQLKTGQDEVLAKYAESCPSDVASCLATNGYKRPETCTETTEEGTLAGRACKSLITTCKSVTGATDLICGSTKTN